MHNDQDVTLKTCRMLMDEFSEDDGCDGNGAGAVVLATPMQTTDKVPDCRHWTGGGPKLVKLGLSPAHREQWVTQAARIHDEAVDILHERGKWWGSRPNDDSPLTVSKGFVWSLHAIWPGLFLCSHNCWFDPDSCDYIRQIAPAVYVDLAAHERKAEKSSVLASTFSSIRYEGVELEDDGEHDDLPRAIATVWDFIKDSLRGRQAVFIGCQAARSRSPATIAGIFGLITKQGWWQVLQQIAKVRVLHIENKAIRSAGGSVPVRIPLDPGDCKYANQLSMWWNHLTTHDTSLPVRNEDTAPPGVRLTRSGLRNLRARDGTLGGLQPPPGFPNSGNQCFLIATLQALSSALIRVENVHRSVVTNSEASCLPPVHNLVRHAVRLFQQAVIAHGEASSLIKMCSEQFPSLVKGGGNSWVQQEQQDSAELLGLVMAHLDMEQRANPTAAFGILSLFDIHTKATRACGSCKQHRDVCTAYQGLVLNMPPGEERNFSLERLLEWFLFPEQLGASEVWNHECPVHSSNEDGAHTTTVSLTSCPEILRFTLARFEQQQQQNVRGGMKDSRPVSIPLKIKMGAYLVPTRDDEDEHVLNAVILHIGNDLSGGHFEAVVQRNSRWYCCSDKIVQELEHDVEQLPPYLRSAVEKGQVHQVFYVRGNQPSEASLSPARKKLRTPDGGRSVTLSAHGPQQANAASSPPRKLLLSHPASQSRPAGGYGE